MFSLGEDAVGKKKSEWNTREKKRAEKNGNPLKCCMRILRHFFSDMTKWIEETDDPRNPAYITYTQSDLVYLGILKNLCSVESMRGMGESFNEEVCIRNLAKVAGDMQLKEIPHYDTLNYYLEKLSPQAFADIRTRMVRALLRSRDFDDSRIQASWRVILDGTGVSYFKERHCENCLTATTVNKDGTKTIQYYHKVLEAKLVLAENIIISLDTEFIENEREDVTKQDCEIKAAKRLMERLKATFPRMKICIQGDALYAASTIMKICAQNGWKYILTHKKNRQPTVDEFYEQLDDTIDKTRVAGVGAEKGTGFFYNHLEEYAGKEDVLNICEYRYEEPGKNGDIIRHRMVWITNITLTKSNLGNIINVGRGRWKIENEGFNNQKNILYKIEHLNSRNPQAMKNHYLLTQISDIIMQLYLAWDEVHSTIKKGIRNMAAWIMESFRNQPLTDGDMDWIQKRTSIYLQ